jgi:rod shape-determining protein MreD
MRRGLYTAGAILLAVLLQVGLAPALSLGGVVPNFLLLVTVTLALVEGPNWGAAAGFSAGLLFDLLGTGPVGPMALVLAIVGFVSGMLHANMFAEGWLLPLSVLAMASVATGLMYQVVLFVLGDVGSFWTAFVTVVLPESLYNVALGLLIYPVLARFLRRDRPMNTFRRLA